MTDTATLSSAAYTDYAEWKDWREDDFGKPDAATTRYFDTEIGRRVPNPADAALLEIGFGNGALLGWASARFRSVSGVEVNQILIDRARKAGFTAHDSIEVFPARPEYDVVVAMDVLEHLTSEEIDTLLGGVALRLRSNGVLIARFPNGDSPFGRIVQNGDVTHINAIGYIKMNYFARRAGMHLEYIAAPAWVAQPSLRERVRQAWIRGKRYLFERAIASMYFQQRLTFDMNYVAVLRKPG